MKKTEEMLRLERDMNGDPELREKLDAEIRRIVEAKEAESDGEAMAKAAAALGYTVTPEELERSAAELEAVDDNDLDTVAGGLALDEADEDENGHDLWCVTAWHCYTVTIHSMTEDRNAACFRDYMCRVLYHHTTKDSQW